MKLHRNLVDSIHLIILLTLLHSQCSSARTLASTAQKLATSNGSITVSLEKQHNATTVESFDSQQTNQTAVTTMPAQTQSLELLQPTSSNMLTHILRKKRETEVEMPFDFNTMHLPCDFDQKGEAEIIGSFPNHCIWAWNNKYAHEGAYRVFKTYQLEGFFFGQYYERLKRFEIDPHTWDYTNTGV